MEKVINDLRMMQEKYHSNRFSFCDWTINLTQEHMENLCDNLLKHNIQIQWIGWARTNLLNETLMTKMKKAGCVGLRLGIESGSDKILTLMQKGIKSRQAAEILKCCTNNEIETYITLIVGFPHETQEDVEATASFIKENRAYITRIVSLNIFLLEANSPMFNRPEDFGICNISPEYSCGHRNYYSFDETEGLKWQQKIIQQKKDYYRLLKILYYNILSRNEEKARWPYWIWYLIKSRRGFFYKHNRESKIDRA